MTVETKPPKESTLASRVENVALCHSCSKPNRVLLIVFFNLEKQQWCPRCVVGSVTL